MTLDLDEIARRQPFSRGCWCNQIAISPADRDALVAAARREAAHRVVRPQGLDIDELERCVGGEDPPDDIVLSLSETRLLLRRTRVPEMPADVAGISVIVSKDALADAVLNAHTLIESLERQRKEAVACSDEFEARADAADAEIAELKARAEQAEKELAEERDKLNTARRCLADREELAQKDAARLAALEAVVTAHKTTLRSEGTMRQWDGWRRALRETPDASAPRDMFEAWIECLCEDLNDALAALDRKEPKT